MTDITTASDCAPSQAGLSQDQGCQYTLGPLVHLHSHQSTSHTHELEKINIHTLLHVVPSDEHTEHFHDYLWHE